MPKTDVHCTRCGRELGPWEDVVIVMAGTVAPAIGDMWWSAQGSDNPYLEVLCSTCREPKPNRVVVEVREGLFDNIRASQPDAVIITVLDYDTALGRDENGIPYPAEIWAVAGERDFTIKQLNAVEEDYPIVDDAKGWPEHQRHGKGGSMNAEYYLRRWPLGSLVFDTLYFTVEEVVGHLVGGWLIGKDEYTDPETNPWVALVTAPVSPKELYPRLQPGDCREHDESRLVAGELPEKYRIHVVSGSTYALVIPTCNLKAAQHGLNLLVVSWQPGNGYIIVQTDPGDPGVGIPGGSVAHTSSGDLQVEGYPEFAIAKLLDGEETGQHLFSVAWWIFYHQGEGDEATWESLGRGFVAHEPDQTYGACD